MEEVLQDADLLHHVFSFLPAESLANAIETCQEWKRTAVRDSLWFLLCRQLWEGKLHVPEQFLEAASSSSSGRGGRIRGLDAYVGSLRDSRRNRLRSDELLDCRWHLRFKVDHRVLHRREEDEQPECVLYSDGAELETATFRSDGTFVSSVAGAPSATRQLRWRLITNEDSGPSLPPPHSDGARADHSAWHLDSPSHRDRRGPDRAISHSVSSVRIGAYPLLTVRRIPSDWGWTMHNRFVEIRSYLPRCEQANPDGDRRAAHE
jgi:hypothetical protein